MPRNVSPTMRLLVILLVAGIGAGLNFFFGNSLGSSPAERALWGGFIGGLVGNMLLSYANS